MKNIASPTVFLVVISICVIVLDACNKTNAAEANDYPKALSSYGDFKSVVNEVENHRLQRLVNLETFLKMQKESNTIILDSRSADRYTKKHVAGAIHLAFTDFTQPNLNRLIPDPNTRILIYCNNNFIDDPVNFARKTASPANNILQNQKPLTLALNIPTYLNLYGYGYKNVYELDELVGISDPRIEFVVLRNDLVNLMNTCILIRSI